MRDWIVALCLLCGLFITWCAWAGRLSMTPDGMSYLDMAHRLLQRDFSPLLHPYWSPLYPCLLAVALKVFPTPAMEFQAAHAVNWLIALLSLASFTFFLAEQRAFRASARGGESTASFRCRTGIAYMLFLWGTVEAIGLTAVSPDLCVAVLAYLAIGLCYRMAAGGARWYLTAGLLGVTLGVACLTKAAMAPLSGVLLVLLAVQWRFVPRRLGALGITVLAFAIVFGPFVLALSRQQHHLTFGEAGKLNYAWLVQGGIPVHAGWIGQPPATGTPVHPPRLISSDPPVLEFENSVGGTYPLWYDPSYFHEGIQVKVDVKKQISVMLKSLTALRWAFGSALYPLLAGLLVLAGLASPRQVWSELSRSVLLSWSIVAFAMFAMVTIEPRYIAAFMVLFWLALYDAFSPGRLKAVARGAIGATAVCILLLQVHALSRMTPGSGRSHLVVANELERLGLHAGDEIATVGSGFGAFYAQLAGLRIAANIGWAGDDRTLDEQPQTLDDAKLDAIRDKLVQLHVKAIVSEENHVATARNAWHAIDHTGYTVLMLVGR